MTETVQVDTKTLRRIDLLLATAQNALSDCLIIRKELASVSTGASKKNQRQAEMEEKFFKVMAKCQRIRDGKKIAKLKNQNNAKNII